MTDLITVNEVTNVVQVTETPTTVTVVETPTTVVINEPGVPEAAGAASVTFIVDGAGSTIQPGVAGSVPIPFGCVITSWTLVANTTGSIVLDIWKVPLLSYPPSAADSITAGAKPTISSGAKATSSTLTGWTTAVSAGDVLAFNVDSATAIGRVTLSLSLARL